MMAFATARRHELEASQMSADSVRKKVSLLRLYGNTLPRSASPAVPSQCPTRFSTQGGLITWLPVCYKPGSATSLNLISGM